MNRNGFSKFGAALFGIVVPLPAVAGSYWLTWKLGDWMCDQFFSVRTPEEVYVTNTGSNVALALLILPTIFWVRALVLFVKDLRKPSAEPETHRETIDNFISTAMPLSTENSISYVFKRAGVIVYFVILCMAYAFFFGRMIALFMGKPFLPSGEEGKGIAVALVLYLFMLCKSAWWFANKEIEHVRMGDPVVYDRAVVIHFLIPYGLIFLVAGTLLTGSGSSAVSAGISVLGWSFLLYLGYRQLVGTVTNWTDEQRRFDRWMGPTEKPKSTHNVEASGVDTSTRPSKCPPRRD
jgi:hypothetical protein